LHPGISRTIKVVVGGFAALLVLIIVTAPPSTDTPPIKKPSAPTKQEPRGKFGFPPAQTAQTEGEARRKKLQDEARQLSERNAAELAKHSKHKALIVQVERKVRWGKDSSVTVEVGRHLVDGMEFYEFHFEGNNLYCKMMATDTSYSSGRLRLHYEYDTFDEDGVLLEGFDWLVSDEKPIRGEPFIGHSLSIKSEVTLIKIK